MILRAAIRAFRTRTPLRRVAALFLVILCLPAAAPAQSPFAAAITVNDRAVTYFEIEQRRRFFELLNAPGNLEERARESLVDERLQAELAERVGVTISPEQLEQGMAEFAGRANLDTDQFIVALEREGIAAETFRDFVLAGLRWREVLRSEVGARARVSEEEIDRALALSAGDGGARIWLAELVIPLEGNDPAAVRARIEGLSESLDGDIGGFSAAARRFSAAPTAGQGGSLGWRPLSAIPPGLRAIVLALPPGGVTEPLPLGPAIAIFQLRGFEEGAFVGPTVTAVDYATLAIPGAGTERGLSEAEALRNSLDSCDDLYGERPGGFTRTALPVEDVPADISFELMKLDEGEVSVALTANEGRDILFLMLCGRSTELPEGGREQVREALFQQRLESYASGLLEEMRADAIIREAGQTGQDG